MYFELLFPNLLSKFRSEASLSFGSQKFEIFKNFRVFEHSSPHAGSTKRLMDLLFIPSDRKLSEESKTVLIFVLELIVFELPAIFANVVKKFEKIQRRFSGEPLKISENFQKQTNSHPK